MHGIGPRDPCALLTAFGAAMGGELAFNIETAGDSPVWHRPEVDVLPFRHDAPAPAPPTGSGTDANGREPLRT
ncbi:MAG TPA: hypothetical protein VEP49_06280 [Acidimicrobiia bacterium]|nr:hypothetical protein [Acidimicrobiia bacterium]